MRNESATLAHTITRGSSKQSYFIARLLVDKDLVDDCLRAYAYFRWADDIVDLSSQSREERIAFIQCQQALVNALYKGKRPVGLKPEEQMIADLIAHDRGANSGLQSFIRKFMAILAFDAGRKGRTISETELSWYSDYLGQAVTDAILYFVGNRHHYTESGNRYLAATAAHITHMLRDMAEDLAEGYVNIPDEWLVSHRVSLAAGGVDLADMNSPAFREWVRNRVELARVYFRQGKRYLDDLDVLRCKIAGYWYCARFECVLDAIERDGYVLRPVYNERRKITTRLKMGWLAVSLALRHLVQHGRRRSQDCTKEAKPDSAKTDHKRSIILARRS